MITETHKEAIIKALGKNHISKIKVFADANELPRANGEKLEKKALVKDDNSPYSKPTFSAVLNGRLDLPKVEDEIFAAAGFYLEETQYLQKQKEEARNAFVEKVKTTA
jgi:hypothetical protein